LTPRKEGDKKGFKVRSVSLLQKTAALPRGTRIVREKEDQKVTGARKKRRYSEE